MEQKIIRNQLPEQFENWLDLISYLNFKVKNLKVKELNLEFNKSQNLRYTFEIDFIKARLYDEISEYDFESDDLLKLQESCNNHTYQSFVKASKILKYFI